jgi:hypothetical protein
MTGTQEEVGVIALLMLNFSTKGWVVNITPQLLYPGKNPKP